MALVVAIQSLSRVWLFETPWSVACQPSLSFTMSRSLLRYMCIEVVMLHNHLLLCHPFLLLPLIFPNIRIFSNKLAFHIMWPKDWSFSTKIQSFQLIFRTDLLSDRLPWSPCCPKDSLESSPASQFKNINSSAPSLCYGPTLTSAHDYWRNHRFDYTDLIP